MAEDSSSEDKTEEGSEKRVREALDNGNVPHSREATVFLSLAAMLVVSSLMLTNAVRTLTAALVPLFANPTRDPFSTLADTFNLLSLVGKPAAEFLWPILLVLGSAGIIASLAQGVPRVVLGRITPKWSKLSPVAGLKRMFGADGKIEFLKSLAKFAIVIVIMAMILRSQGDSLIAILTLDPGALGSVMLGLIGRLLAGALVAYSLLTGGDLVWARIKWRRDLRMTKQEVKDEAKQADGDPIMKAKRRSIAMDRARRRMMAAVPRATLVIANPTHYAIAIRYVREEGGAPVVLAKGQDLIALKIREIAETNGIPVIEDKALARSMYDHVEVSQLIPPEFYKAVAELIHFLQARSAKGRRPAVKA